MPIYHATCPNKNCKSCYTEGTKCILQKGDIQHNRKEKKQHTDSLEEDEKKESVDERFQDLGQKILELL